MNIKMLLLYFVIGGVVVSAITYLGSMAKSQLAAFAAFFPSISVITLCSMYFTAGNQASISYAKSMLLMLPSWVLYIISVIFLLPRIGLVGSLAASVAVYVGTAFLAMSLI